MRVVTRPDAIHMVGRRFGCLTVVDFAKRKDYGVSSRGWRYRVLRYVVRCDCGREYEAMGQAIRRSKWCSACRDAESARRIRTEMSVALPSGRTIAQVAAESGVSLDTVYARWRRGWPEQDLGVPARRGKRWHRGTSERVRSPVTRDRSAP